MLNLLVISYSHGFLCFFFLFLHCIFFCIPSDLHRLKMVNNVCWVVLLNRIKTILENQIKKLWKSKFSIRNVKLNVKSCQNELLCLLFANKRFSIPTVNLISKIFLFVISWEMFDEKQRIVAFDCFAKIC